MNRHLLRTAGLIAAVGWSTLGHCVPLGSLGFYSIRTDVSGSAFAGAGDHRAEAPNAATHPSTFTFSTKLEASVENAGGTRSATSRGRWSLAVSGSSPTRLPMPG